jgi:hypothetical protein
VETAVLVAFGCSFLVVIGCMFNVKTTNIESSWLTLKIDFCYRNEKTARGRCEMVDAGGVS